MTEKKVRGIKARGRGEELKKVKGTSPVAIFFDGRKDKGKYLIFLILF